MKQIKYPLKTLKIEKMLWWGLWAISLISLLSVVETYVRGGSDGRDPEWMELVIIPFYFTIQSNFLAFLLATLVCFKLVKSQQLIRVMATFMAVNLFVTFVVYWIIIFLPNPKVNLFDWIRNLTLHTLTPILAIIIFIYRYTQRSHNLEKRRLFVSSLLHLIYPIIYIIIAIGLYFILGAGEKDAVYSFLKVKSHPLSFVIHLLGIAVFYYGLTVLFVFIANPKRTRAAKIK